MVTTQDIEQQITDAKVGQADLASLQDLAQKAKHWAQEISQEKGVHSSDSAYAWNQVEELLAVISHRQAEQKNKTYLDNYCQEHPEAIKCRVYDV
ncbi:MAG: hypothetical protein GVY04_13530 [Cyanobacteria bacterium]|jgi:hypothetical protein|nr:hypothetical protein [Cyanobacteria bacterium GSL.Bin1]